MLANQNLSPSRRAKNKSSGLALTKIREGHYGKNKNVPAGAHVQK